MSNEKSGEESRQRILEVAEQLFLEKGYDKTTINDIVNGLGNMTKGVIYHHFTSKQEIFETLLASYTPGDPFKNLKGQTGLEKLRDVFRKELLNFKKQSVFYAGQVYFQTPRLIGEYYLAMMNDYVPRIEQLVHEGMRDGSIETKYPREIIEFTLLFSNLVIGLRLGELSAQEAQKKLEFITEVLNLLGVPIFDQELSLIAHELLTNLKK